MTKSKQNPLVLLPQGIPKASASGQRKEFAAGKLFWQNSARFWKLQAMDLPSFSCRCLAWQMISESEFISKEYWKGLLFERVHEEELKEQDCMGMPKQNMNNSPAQRPEGAWGNQPGAS